MFCICAVLQSYNLQTYLCMFLCYLLAPVYYSFHSWTLLSNILNTFIFVRCRLSRISNPELRALAHFIMSSWTDKLSNPITPKPILWSHLIPCIPLNYKQRKKEVKIPCRNKNISYCLYSSLWLSQKKCSVSQWALPDIPTAPNVLRLWSPHPLLPPGSRAWCLARPGALMWPSRGLWLVTRPPVLAPHWLMPAESWAPGRHTRGPARLAFLFSVTF